jgi:hypothetical protein
MDGSVNPDYFLSERLGQLYDDLEEADKDRYVQETLHDQADQEYRNLLIKFNQMKLHFDERVAEENQEIKDKAMIYLSLINEYEVVLNSTFQLNGTAKFLTPEIQQLRKRGGLIV